VEESGPSQADIRLAGAGETVLLVEDEPQVRAVATEALRELGCQVLEAGDGPEALHVLLGSCGLGVKLLVTDVGLPNGQNGRQVAEIALGDRPGLKVLFITGYAGSLFQDQLAPGMDVIGKPFTLGTPWGHRGGQGPKHDRGWEGVAATAARRTHAVADRSRVSPRSCRS